MISIVGDGLLHTPRTVTSLAGLVAEKRVESWPTRTVADRRYGCSACGVTREFG